ncbi:MAG: phage antirepressor KilAC domain-containing protein [Prevotella sp.]|nr:phage antirepressor KilAC domain-containing protein [Prevotella sp.]
MTTEEKMMMQPTQEFIRKLQKKRNAGTDDCILSSDLAREIGITALDLHHYLIDVGFLFRERSTYELKLCKRYAGLGYAKTRSHFRYNSKGDLVETRFPVWTPKGYEYIKNLIQGKGHKDKETNKSKK